ncbi:MAG: MFS transporter [Ruminococcaceae bacterium]|nr:MFS transporter [Oscillospiraceae bacterium]
MNRNDKEFIVQKIRSEYTEKKTTELDELKSLDKKVKKPIRVMAYTVGIFSALVMGSGMSLVMTDVAGGNTMTAGIVVGVVGMAIALLNYPTYKVLMSKRRVKYADEIINLSNKIMKG